MFAHEDLSASRVGGRFAIIRALAAGITLAAGGSQAAQGQAIDRSIDASAILNCDTGESDPERFVVERANGEARVMVLCNTENHRGSLGTARALSAAIDAETSDTAYYSHARMPELLNLRMTRARTHVDPTIAPEERFKTLGVLNVSIKALEAEILNSMKSN